MHIISSPSQAILRRVAERVELAPIYEVVYPMFTSLIREWAGALNSAEFTLEEVYSVLSQVPDSCTAEEVTADMCCVDTLPQLRITTEECASFVVKMRRIPHPERCGMLFIMNESWLAGSPETADAVLERFSSHGVRLRVDE